MTNKTEFLLESKMNEHYIKQGEISIFLPFDEEEVLKPLWDKGFETCLVENQEGCLKYIIMKNMQ